MDPHDYLKALRKRWIVIAILGVLGGGVAYTYAESLPDSFQATSEIFVSSTQGQTTSELVQGSTYTQNLVQSYSQLATTPKVLTPVIAELGLQVTPAQLAKSITAATPLNTVIIQITVTDGTPARAAAIANSVGESLAKTATALSPQNSSDVASISMEIVTPAQAPVNPIAPNRRLIEISGLAVGLAAGVLYAIGRALFDTRLRSPRDIERLTDVPVIGNVERRRRHDPQPNGITMRLAPHSLIAEDYRRVRTNLEFADVDNAIRSIVVTSAMPGEGKTTMSINIALAMAERSLRVLLIDADLRRPSVATYAQIEGAAGLTTVLVGSADLDEVIQHWAPNVDILTSGVIPPNPNQLLGSSAMARLLSTVIGQYDFVIVDTPPLLPASDALTLTHMTDGAVVVSLYNSTTRQKLTDALAALSGVKARTIGVVLNQTKPKARDEYYSSDVTKMDAPEGAAPRQTGAAEVSAPSARPSTTATAAGPAEPAAEETATAASSAETTPSTLSAPVAPPRKPRAPRNPRTVKPAHTSPDGTERQAQNDTERSTPGVSKSVSQNVSQSAELRPVP
ncbi:polysaccharide biosynthesis tyrosine autokinase [Subtercola boreus]|uniref:non-specific protein-tyrosine kinase n=1 Tax=Subtercola boreus TaxID=120213 RepID=A0A3E0WC79_9MICO|nr:polysaccharide biosynthesis tyrosine autokinase [Subtercola boreus]RFA21194.1 hypothetical protein B7R24_07340 [Subtercola boreus]RFA21577.1 hypothetical protein B7R23_07285 [Subtercola boreus]RFA27546.1 hypothetical protein B7R25_07410 [Subtercola boreus]